jgi:hypothetical protein
MDGMQHNSRGSLNHARRRFASQDPATAFGLGEGFDQRVQMMRSLYVSDIEASHGMSLGGNRARREHISDISRAACMEMLT